LFKGTNKAVPGEGNSEADIMFIGEAPGKAEDLSGIPFVGAAGKFLAQLLEVINLNREDVYITNIVKHRPPDNRDPQNDEIEACKFYLDSQIKIINPKLIVTLGRHAMNRFMPGLKISEVHGKARPVRLFESGVTDKVFFPLYHPASALYNPGLRGTLIDDMKKIPLLLKNIDNFNNFDDSQ